MIGEYLLASQQGPDLRDLPLVPGDPKDGGAGKERFAKGSLSLLFNPFVFVIDFMF